MAAKQQSSLKDKPGRENEVVKGQKIGCKGQSKNEKKWKGRLGRQRVYNWEEEKKKTKVAECLPKEITMLV